MLLHMYGLARQPIWWHLSRIPLEGGAALAILLQDKVPGALNMTFFVGQRPLADLTAVELEHLWQSGMGRLVAKPEDTDSVQTPEPRLLLVTTQGLDSGRIFPLTRLPLTVGRGDAKAQIRDPWLSAHDFDIHLSSNGPVIRTASARPVCWKTDETFVAGRTSFKLHRGEGTPLQAPTYPGDFEITPGQPPSPPNVLLQIIGAAAPLIIGIVLMVVTGMWYFLLFSGISVIVAFVLITQYRRARARFIQKIHVALDRSTKRFRRSIFTPHQLMLALTARTRDPLALTATQPPHPVIHLGTGTRKATLPHTQEVRRWEQYMASRVELIFKLEPGQRTIITGKSNVMKPLKSWIIAQLLRHARATGTGVVIDGVHIGGAVTVEISDNCNATSSTVHQLIFADYTNAVTDNCEFLVDLTARQVRGPWIATKIVPTGISYSSLARITSELELDKPNDQLNPDTLTISTRLMEGNTNNELVTALGTGVLGLKIDLVADGPHMLVTGTTGSGKSELLLTALIGFVTRYPPCEVSMILLDFKGGSSFNILASLPHTMSVETNHIAPNSLRSLKAIAAELFRRESLFAKYHVADYATFRREVPHIALPRLIVAIDELRVLVEQDPYASTTLAHLAATGRSLGFHLIIATQRTQGAVNADIRANIGSLVTLRTATEHDSWDVLGTADAFTISPTTPGRAYFKAGAGRPQLFQTSRYELDDEPIILQPFKPAQSLSFHTTTDWSSLIRKLDNHAALLRRPEPVILPALPERVSQASLGPFPENTHVIPIGLVDDPKQARQYPVCLGSGTSSSEQHLLIRSVAWIGAAGSGIREALDHVVKCVLSSEIPRWFLDGRHHVNSSTGWHAYVHHSWASGDVLKQFLADLTTILAANSHITLVIADWGSWVNLPVAGSFQSFEDQLIQILRQYPTTLKVYVFGGRDLAGSRLIGMIPDRFYLPKNSSAEHQMIWPKLLDIPHLTGRAVLITAEEPSGGWEVQLVDGW